MEPTLQNFKNFLLGSNKSVSSVDNTASHVRAFLRSKKVTDLSVVTKELVSEYFAEKQPHCSVEKFNMMIWSLKTFFQWAKVGGLVFPKQKHPLKKIKETISEHELVNVLEPRLIHIFEDSLHVKAILYFLFYTGIHHSEIFYIRKKNFSLDTNELIYSIPKKKIIRRVPLPDLLVRILRTYFTVYADESNVFNIKSGDINRIFRSLQKNEALGKKRAIKPHLLRNSFARLCLEKGVDLFIIQQLMDHKDIKTTFGFFRLMSDEIKASYLKKVKGI